MNEKIEFLLDKFKIKYIKGKDIPYNGNVISFSYYILNSFETNNFWFVEYKSKMDSIKKGYLEDRKIPCIILDEKEDVTIDKLIPFKSKGCVIEDFNNYKKPSLYLSNSICNGFKCNLEDKNNICQNSELVKTPTKFLSLNFLINQYLKNPITKSIVFSGLENFDEFNQMYYFIKILREEYFCDDEIIIYTGFKKEEVIDKVELLKEFSKDGSIIIKYGRYNSKGKARYDEILGIALASDNQYAERI